MTLKIRRDFGIILEYKKITSEIYYFSKVKKATSTGNTTNSTDVAYLSNNGSNLETYLPSN